MYGVPQPIVQNDGRRETRTIKVRRKGCSDHVANGSRATRALRNARGRKTDSKTAHKFEVRELDLVAHGEELKKFSIWPAFQSIFYGPRKQLRLVTGDTS